MTHHFHIYMYKRKVCVFSFTVFLYNQKTATWRIKTRLSNSLFTPDPLPGKQHTLKCLLNDSVNGL